MVYVLLFIAVILTSVMFVSRQSMLGFPSLIFWAIAGASAYQMKTGTWDDIYFYIAFISLFGMTLFTGFGAYGLREKKDVEADKGELIDEEIDDEPYDDGMGVDEERKPSKQTQAVRDRAEARRTGASREKKW